MTAAAIARADTGAAAMLSTGEIYRRANRIHQLSQIAMEISAPAHAKDSARAARLLAEIAALAGQGGP